MRWWHFELLSVLPKKQKIGQWREVVASVGGLEKFGVLDAQHGFALLYDVNKLSREEFKRYVGMVWNNFEHKTKTDKLTTVLQRVDNLPDNVFGKSTLEDIHDLEYMKICYFNLLEKYKCNRMTVQEFMPIKFKYLKMFNDVVKLNSEKLKERYKM